MTLREFSELTTGRATNTSYTSVKLPQLLAGSTRRAVLTGSANRVKSGSLNPGKAQGVCGACYAHASNTVLEGALAI